MSFLSLDGDVDSLDCCGPMTHDFLRRFVKEREGEGEGESACLTASGRPRSGFGSADGSRLLVEKGRNLEERRDAGVGLS